VGDVVQLNANGVSFARLERFGGFVAVPVREIQNPVADLERLSAGQDFIQPHADKCVFLVGCNLQVDDRSAQYGERLVQHPAIKTGRPGIIETLIRRILWPAGTATAQKGSALTGCLRRTNGNTAFCSRCWDQRPIVQVPFHDLDI